MGKPLGRPAETAFQRERPGRTRELKHLSTAIGKANANSSVAASEREPV